MQYTSSPATDSRPGRLASSSVRLLPDAVETPVDRVTATPEPGEDVGVPQNRAARTCAGAAHACVDACAGGRVFDEDLHRRKTPASHSKNSRGYGGQPRRLPASRCPLPPGRGGRDR